MPKMDDICFCQLCDSDVNFEEVNRLPDEIVTRHLEGIYKAHPRAYKLAMMTPAERKFHDAKAKREQVQCQSSD